MNLPITLLVLPFLIATVTASAESVDFYIGAYTKPGGNRGIERGSLNTTTGELKSLGLAAEAKNPSFLAVHPRGGFLYAAIEDSGGAVGAFAIEKDGALRHLNNESSKGSGNCHVFVDPAGKNVLAANYGSGSVACLPIREDGSVGPASSFIQHKGTSVDPKRQKGPHAHSVYIHGPFAYACDLGTDDVFVYRFDPKQGTLTPNNPPSGKVPPGSGPRHLAFHPSAKFAYTCNEMTSAVTAFAHDSAKGTLTPLQTVSTLQDKKTGNSTAEIFCHPQGRFLYVSNRGDDTIAVFAIGKDGNVKLIQNAPTGVKVPRGFAISPDGGWLVVAGQNSNDLTSHKVDPATGKLTASGKLENIGAPVCVVFAVQK